MQQAVQGNAMLYTAARNIPVMLTIPITWRRCRGTVTIDELCALQSLTCEACDDFFTSRTLASPRHRLADCPPETYRIPPAIPAAATQLITGR